ncbi:MULTISPECIES: hypothetical protein [Paenibacillus]|uniref:hypothetical protein n=1 Tax=Paenibacillus TaxID=44249 RepID=UPI002FE34468
MSKFVSGQLRFEVGEVNKGLLRRYFVEFGSLGAYFWKKAAQTLIWVSYKVNKALFDRYYAVEPNRAKITAQKSLALH